MARLATNCRFNNLATVDLERCAEISILVKFVNKIYLMSRVALKGIQSVANSLAFTSMVNSEITFCFHTKSFWTITYQIWSKKFRIGIEAKCK